MKRSRSVKKLLRFYKKHLKRFRKNLHKACKTNKKEAIHNLRVNVKNIRAVHELYDIVLSDKKRAKKLNRSFKSIFRYSGQIREFQINMQLLKNYTQNHDLINRYTNYCHQQIAIGSEQLTIVLPEVESVHVKKKLAAFKKAFLSVPGVEVFDKANQFIIQKVESIKEMLPEVKENHEIMHEIRKELKEIKSVYQALYVGIGLPQRKIFKEIKKTETQIGHWHDLEVLSTSLNTFKFENQSLSRAINKTIHQIEVEKNSSIHQLIADIPYLLIRLLVCLKK